MPEQTTKSTPAPRERSRWRWKTRDWRWLCYLLILGGVAAWKFVPRPWTPSITLETPHHVIYSTATRPQTEDTARALGLLYKAYTNKLGKAVPLHQDHPPLKVKLFKDRAEFRWVNPNLGWAEAFYREPYCRAYYSESEVNPYHWMLHESVHQLNHEVAHLKLEKWLEEGLAEYFSTSRLQEHNLAVGHIDFNTYPVWWIAEIATEPELSENLRNGSIIPLRAIITNEGGPSLNRYFNLYYLHWWTLTHFLFENGRYRNRVLELIQQGGNLESFEKTVGPVDQVQAEWHASVRRLRADLLRGVERTPQPREPSKATNSPPKR